MNNLKLLLATLAISASFVSFNSVASSYDSTFLDNNISIDITQEVDSRGGLITKNKIPWTVSSWGKCNAKCGSEEGGHYYSVNGVQYRTVSCKAPNGECAGSKPSTSQSCKRYCYAPNKGH